MLDKVIRWLKLIYSASPDFRGLVKKISHLAVYGKLIHYQARRQSSRDLKGPFNLVIETANLCNARCLMCPYPKMKRSKRVMADEIFNKIVERVKKEDLPLNKVFFSGMGEPLIDPKIVSRIKAFKNLGVQVKLYTNASLLSKKISEQLVNLNLDEINISFNGANPKQYSEVMGFDFEKTSKNIYRLLKIKKVKKSHLPQVRLSLIVLDQNNKDIQNHFKKWHHLVDSVTVSQAHEWGGGVKIKLETKNQKPCHAGRQAKTVFPCRSLWHTFVIDNSGNFVICCRDYESKFVLGNIKTDSFCQIKRNPILKSFKQLHLNFKQANLPKVCQFCNFPYQEGVEWFLPRTID